MRLVSTVLSCLLWICRRNEDDIISIYNLLTPYVRLVTNCNMLNFGYWNADTEDLFSAQRNLSSLVGELAELHSGLRIIDAGSGFSSPALYWESKYFPVDIICVDTNCNELRIGIEHRNRTMDRRNICNSDDQPALHDQNIELSWNSACMRFINASSMLLPFRPKTIDRVIALESAHHFRHITQFIEECRRVLRDDSGMLVIALPVITKKISRLHMMLKLGILYLSWTSQRYDSSEIKSLIMANGFTIREVLQVGPNVYGPLTDYYLLNRGGFKQKIIHRNKSSPLLFLSTFINSLIYDFVEKMICRSAFKMKELSKKGFLDYIIIKAELTKS